MLRDLRHHTILTARSFNVEQQPNSRDSPLISRRRMATTSADNPLDTPDQRSLDARACKIWAGRAFHFSSLRKVALALYTPAIRLRGARADPSTADDLSAAIDELIFRCIQKAINSESSDPKICWVNTASRSVSRSASRSAWQGHGQAVPGGRYSYDNPDCIYRTIPVSSRHEYLISGRRSDKGPVDVSFSLLSNPNSQWTVGYLGGSDLVMSDDGHFEIMALHGQYQQGSSGTLSQRYLMQAKRQATVYPECDRRLERRNAGRSHSHSTWAQTTSCSSK